MQELSCTLRELSGSILESILNTGFLQVSSIEYRVSTYVCLVRKIVKFTVLFLEVILKHVMIKKLVGY